MTRPTLLMLHGWGLDAALWAPLRAALADDRALVWDRGYFGAPSAPESAGPVLAIGHSLGSLLLADRPAIGLVAINGFDRFTGADAVPPRMLDRMRRRFAEAPAEVLGDFRARIGAPPAAAGALDTARLGADLRALAGLDRRDTPRPPTLVLHGARDPLLPGPMRELVFAGARRATHPEAGHLLPLTHPAWCAAQISAFADRLAR